MADFNPAISRPIKWSVGDNKYDENGKAPRRLSLFIPEDSILEFAEYLKRLSTQTDKARAGKVWDYARSEEVEVSGFYVDGKGKNGQYGDYGTINPVQIAAADSDSIPF